MKKFNHWNGPSGRPEDSDFRKSGIRELNHLAKEFIESAIASEEPQSHREFVEITRNETTRLAWLHRVGQRRKDVSRFTQWGDQAFAVDCAGLAWAIEKARAGGAVYIAQDEDGYYFAVANK